MKKKRGKWEKNGLQRPTIRTKSGPTPVARGNSGTKAPPIAMRAVMRLPDLRRALSESRAVTRKEGEPTTRPTPRPTPGTKL